MLSLSLSCVDDECCVCRSGSSVPEQSWSRVKSSLSLARECIRSERSRWPEVNDCWISRSSVTIAWASATLYRLPLVDSFWSTLKYQKRTLVFVFNELITKIEKQILNALGEGFNTTPRVCHLYTDLFQFAFQSGDPLPRVSDIWLEQIRIILCTYITGARTNYKNFV